MRRRASVGATDRFGRRLAQRPSHILLGILGGTSDVGGRVSDRFARVVGVVADAIGSILRRTCAPVRELVEAPAHRRKAISVFLVELPRSVRRECKNYEANEHPHSCLLPSAGPKSGAENVVVRR